MGKGAAYKTASCPYCAQKTTDLALVGAYEKYFGAAYKSLLRRVETLAARPDETFSTTVLRQLGEDIASQDSHWRYWQAVLDLQPLPPVPADPLVLGPKVRAALQAAISRKRGAMLEEAHLSASEAALADEWNRLAGVVTARNEQVVEALVLITLHKTKGASTADKELANARRAHETLKETKIRFGKTVARLCDQYIEQQRLRNGAVKERDRLGDEITRYSNSVLKRYGTSINSYLKRFGTTFSLTPVTKNMRGGAGAEWGLLVLGDRVSSAEGAKVRGPRCFRSTLSAGDRTALALAFYLSVVSEEAGANAGTVVLDDPMCSLDGHRRTITVKIILELAGKFEQVIVLSHDASFLGRIYRRHRKHLKRKDVKTLLLSPGVSGSKVHEWDIDEALLRPFEKNCSTLMKFAEGYGTAVDAARKSTRELMEFWMRMNYPLKFKYSDSLGGMLGQIEGEVGSSLSKDMYDRLSDINDVATRQHHDTDEESDRGEVLTMVSNALDIVLPERRMVEQ